MLEYEAPEMEVILFDTADVIVTSGIDDGIGGPNELLPQ